MLGIEMLFADNQKEFLEEQSLVTLLCTEEQHHYTLSALLSAWQPALSFKVLFNVESFLNFYCEG